MKKKLLFSIICGFSLLCWGCTYDINNSQHAIGTNDQDVSIWSKITASYEINEAMLPKWYKEHLSKWKNTTLQRYRYESEDSAWNTVNYKQIDWFEIYAVNQNNQTNTTPIWDIIRWNNTSAKGVYDILQKTNPYIKKYCKQEINYNSDGSVSAYVWLNDLAKELIKSLTGSSLEDLKRNCNVWTIYCENSNKNSECEYRYNLKNGWWRSTIVFGSLKKHQ